MREGFLKSIQNWLYWIQFWVFFKKIETNIKNLIRGGISVIIGTAGHIDHGKSALVYALTQVNPDRLQEE